MRVAKGIRISEECFKRKRCMGWCPERALATHYAIDTWPKTPWVMAAHCRSCAELRKSQPWAIIRLRKPLDRVAEVVPRG